MKRPWNDTPGCGPHCLVSHMFVPIADIRHPGLKYAVQKIVRQNWVGRHIGKSLPPAVCSKLDKENSHGRCFCVCPAYDVAGRGAVASQPGRGGPGHVVAYCRKYIVARRPNRAPWVSMSGVIITIRATSCTIITAHRCECFLLTVLCIVIRFPQNKGI